MSNELSKAIKRKTDAQFRTMGEDRSPSVSEGADGSVVIVDPSVYTIPYVAGKNIFIGTSGSNKVINAIMNLAPGANVSVSEPDPTTGQVTISATIGGKEIDLTGLADGHVLTYDQTNDKFIFTELPDGSEGSTFELEQATETTLGGVKAKARTTENAEVVIDEATGKLFVQVEPTSGSSTLPTFMAQDSDGIKVFDSDEKTNIVATIGRISDPSMIISDIMTPHMTSNTTPSGVASASTEYSSLYAAWYAFDSNASSSYWAAAVSYGWIAYEFTEPTIINKYVIRAATTSLNGAPRDWTFEGWDGVSWVILDTQVNQISWSDLIPREFSFYNSTPFIKYRLNITVNNGRSTLIIGDLELWKIQAGGFLYGVFTELPESGESYTLPQASETTLGGIKAKEKTTESTEVAIDPATGKLYVPTAGSTFELEQATELTLGGIKAKAKTTESVEVTIDGTTGKLYVPEQISASGSFDYGYITVPVDRTIDYGGLQ